MARYLYSATVEADSAEEAWAKLTANERNGAWHHMYVIESEVTPGALIHWAETARETMHQKLIGYSE